MWELVDGARELADGYREQARRHPHNPYYREQVLRNLRRARYFLIRTREIEGSIRRAQEEFNGR
jgi:hypothetical protein